MKEGRRLYRTSDESLSMRQMKKVTGATDWYRKRKREDGEDKTGLGGTVGSTGGLASKRRRLEWTGEEKRMPTRSVIFVDFTTDSGLAKMMRETLAKLETIIGCKVKTVERTGIPLTRQFPLTRLWDGIPCSREGCITCEQGGEEIYPCTRRSLTYKNICLRCHPGGGEKKEKLDDKVEVPAVYIGETSRSLYERGREHWEDFNKKEYMSAMSGLMIIDHSYYFLFI